MKTYFCVSVHVHKAKDIVLGVNGEIYNYTTLQDALEAHPPQVVTRTYGYLA